MVTRAPAGAGTGSRSGPTTVINQTTNIVAPNPGQAHAEVNRVLNGLMRRVS